MAYYRKYSKLNTELALLVESSDSETSSGENDASIIKHTEEYSSLLDC